MKLSKLYSNDSRFKKIEFNPKFNLIIGKVKEYNKNDTDTHNLGKTSLVKLIDFMLLKQIDKNHIFKEYKELFSKHEFYLEILLNNGLFLTIKRKVENNTKVSFKISKIKEILINEINWDHENLSIKKAKEYLDETLGFDVLKKYSYRTFLSYFLKKENDFKVNFENKFMGKHETWKAPLLELINIDSNDYLQKLKKEKELQEIKKKYTDTNDISSSLSDKEATKSLFEKKLTKLRDEVNKFDFYSIDKTITQKAVDTIIFEISKLNKQRYNLLYDINKITNSLTLERNIIDTEEIEILFKEVNLYFPTGLKKNYDDLIEFNKQIFTERKDSMEKSLGLKKNQVIELNKQLVKLNEEQKKILNVIKNNNLYKKIIQQEKEILDLEESIKKLEESIQELKGTIGIIKNKSKLNSVIETSVTNLNLNIIDNSPKINEILREITQNIFENRIGIFDVYLNSNDNPEFKLRYKEAFSLRSTAEEEGGSYGEWLDASFSLAVAIFYHKNSFYKFLFQDGIIESGDNRRKKSFINEVKSICEKFDIQYITTAIEHEINSEEVSETINPSKDIVLELDDLEDGSGTLYGFKF